MKRTVMRIELVTEETVGDVGAPAGTAVHIRGDHARVNVSSVDNSTNTVPTSIEALDRMLSALTALAAEPVKEQAIAAVRDLKDHSGKPSFGTKLRSLLSLASDSAPVLCAIAPYLSALRTLLPP